MKSIQQLTLTTMFVVGLGATTVMADVPRTLPVHPLNFKALPTLIADGGGPIPIKPQQRRPTPSPKKVADGGGPIPIKK